MGDHNVVGEIIWPSQSDIAPTAGYGRKLLENQWEQIPKALTSNGNYVVTGFVLPGSDPDLNVSVPAGKALIAGRFVDIPGATTVTVVASNSNHIYLKLTRDGAGLVTGAVFEVNTTGTAPPDSVKLGTMVASGTAVTSSVDQRQLGPSEPFRLGPWAMGAGSSRSHEGAVTIGSNQNLSGVHYYTDFTLNGSTTLTVPAGKRRLIIVASNSITINGTITASGAGGKGGTLNEPAATITQAEGGTDQPGGGGTTGYQASVWPGGSVLLHGIPLQVGGVANGGNATQVTGSDLALLLNPLLAMGGAGGGPPGGSSTGAAVASGGNGGGSIVLIAPTVMLGSGAVLNTSGTNGTQGADSGVGGGGGAGNVYIAAQTYVDGGATFTMAGGTTGGDGANGVRQIQLY